ncbi:hypothetical protein [uncultured Tateyamaria sp.]|uniref:hypothetical protein n=1 Tax=uncultured Tateyamaria sp. TaxID=455651 RepID=UPI002627E81A|nr:hypothetical protein [uncultured Tateyamaria sp.]
MAQPKRARFYLEDDLRKSAVAGKHNFIARITSVLHSAGFEVTFHPNTMAERIKAAGRRGYALCHMTPPPNARSLTFRRVYHYPFWQIQASDQRWEWDVARAGFDAAACPRAEADRFFGFWRKRIAGPLLDHVADDDFIYVPLQGRITEQRSFQSCSPIEMIRKTRAAFPDMRVIATLHPKETYTQGDMAELEALQGGDPRLEVEMGGRDRLLPRCSFIVTQTSSVAFDGMFFGKPSAVFGKTDFHHVMVDGRDADAFAAVRAHRADYAAYLWWFWQNMAINAGHDSAEAKIRAKLAAAGWPVV